MDMLYLSCKAVHIGRLQFGLALLNRHYSKIICSIFEKYVYDGTSLILYLSTTAFDISESGKMVSGEIGKQQYPVKFEYVLPGTNRDTGLTYSAKHG